MNKQQLIDAISSKTGQTKKDTSATVEALIEAITNELANGGSIQLTGFGQFLTRDRAARTARNLQTGEPLQIGEMRVPAFKAGKRLKEAVKG